jgi:hypothetical protein
VLHPDFRLFSQIRKGAPLHDEWHAAFASGRFRQRQGRAKVEVAARLAAARGMASAARVQHAHDKTLAAAASLLGGCSGGRGVEFGFSGGGGLGGGGATAQEPFLTGKKEPACRPVNTQTAANNPKRSGSSRTRSSEPDEQAASYRHNHGPHADDEDDDEDSKVDPAFALILLGGGGRVHGASSAAAPPPPTVVGKRRRESEEACGPEAGNGGNQVELSECSQMELKNFFLAFNR